MASMLQDSFRRSLMLRVLLLQILKMEVKEVLMLQAMEERNLGNKRKNINSTQQHLQSLS